MNFEILLDIQPIYVITSMSILFILGFDIFDIDWEINDSLSKFLGILNFLLGSWGFFELLIIFSKINYTGYLKFYLCFTSLYFISMSILIAFNIINRSVIIKLTFFGLGLLGIFVAI